jgi:polyhydroxyalkanoate synthesis regulator phasin
LAASAAAGEEPEAAREEDGKIRLFLWNFYGALHNNIGMRTIKKYRNRRLYDTEIKRTVTLDDLRSYLSDNIEFKVIDNAAGKDITLGTLAQVISRPTADFKDYGFKAINAIIKKGGLEGMDIIKKLTLASIGAVNLTREKAEEIFDEMVKRGEMTKDERSEAIKSFIDKSSESAEKVKEKMEELAGRLAEKFSSKLDRKFEELNAKMEQLSKKISEIEKKLG